MQSALKHVVLLSLMLSSIVYAGSPAPQPVNFGFPGHAGKLQGLKPDQAAHLINNSQQQTRTLLGQFGAKFGFKPGQPVSTNTLNCMAFTIQLGVLQEVAAHLSIPAGTLAWAKFQADYWCDDNGKGGDPTQGKAILKEAAKMLPGKATGPASNRDIKPEHSKPFPQAQRDAIATVKPAESWTAAQAALVVGAVLWTVVSETADFMTLGLP